ncbi:WAT1-related protein At1g43650-like [Juglans microcarpa x Juglans regia]|uniref:WAT1-related protein At1g43650-like n=1 Tax=Juglans microcarpa x Juglans regia TaxID=2249226 RepID=UPI001B7E764A|nr:WAT1-related protein At1g43650-like [Juglans microcarpa x Juglans regia]
MAIISKAALNDGISPLVFNAYRQAIAALVLAPFALLFERRTNNMWSFGLFCKIFLAALCGPTVSLDLYYLALQHSSATSATAILNTIPVVTFLLSVLLRIETVGWGTFHGILKIVGIFIAIGGAMLLSFLGLIGSSTATSSHHVGNNKNRFLGPVLMFLCSVAWSLWLIVQPHLLKQYPSKLRLSTLQCLLSSVQATVAAAAFQRNFDSWKIGGDIQLASLAYCGVLGTGVSFGLQVWCIEKKGPFYVAIFFPLALVLTAIFSACVWAERLSCVSILGGVMIIGGLYSVLWARSKELGQSTIAHENRNSG